MTLFTEGRLQAFERMMQDTGKYHRREDSEEMSKEKNGACEKGW